MQYPRTIISILAVTTLIAMCGRLRVGKSFLHVCRLVISMALATAMFPALDAAPVVACTKTMPCNAQPSSPSPGNRRGSNGPSFFANPGQYIGDRIRNGAVQTGIDTGIHNVLSDPKTPQGTVSPNIYNPNGVTPSQSIQPISNPPSNYAPGGFVYPVATRTPSD